MADPRLILKFDFADPEDYLEIERIKDYPQVPELVPARKGAPMFQCAEEVEAYKVDLQRRAAAQTLLPVKWPDPFPFDSELALLAASYAKGLGKVAAFSLAAFRQAYAGGRSLADMDNVLIAAAAAEIHPAALKKGITLRSVKERLR